MSDAFFFALRFSSIQADLALEILESAQVREDRSVIELLTLQRTHRIREGVMAVRVLVSISQFSMFLSIS
jgi:hypothetical protein